MICQPCKKGDNYGFFQQPDPPFHPILKPIPYFIRNVPCETINLPIELHNHPIKPVKKYRTC